jgi:hypothetical protein
VEAQQLPERCDRLNIGAVDHREGPQRHALSLRSSRYVVEANGCFLALSRHSVIVAGDVARFRLPGRADTTSVSSPACPVRFRSLVVPRIDFGLTTYRSLRPSAFDPVCSGEREGPDHGRAPRVRSGTLTVGDPRCDR